MEADDPRLASDNSFLADYTWQWSSWFTKRAEWDHDHCEFCGAKFMASGEDDVLQEGFMAQDGYYWICRECFDDFAETYAWKLAK